MQETVQRLSVTIWNGDAAKDDDDGTNGSDTNVDDEVGICKNFNYALIYVAADYLHIWRFKLHNHIHISIRNNGYIYTDVDKKVWMI